MNRKPSLNRRQFLEAMAATGLYLPFLPSLANAQATGVPKRVVFLMHRNGMFEQSYYPEAVGMTQHSTNVTYKRLADIQGQMSQIFNTSFDPFRNKMTIIRGLDHLPGSGHNRATFLCGSKAVQNDQVGENGPPEVGASIDWIISNSPAFYPTPPLQKSIRFSIAAHRGFSFSRINGTAAALPYMTTDQDFFNGVFGGFSVGGSAGVDGPKRMTFLSEKVLERLSKLTSSPRLGSFDRQRLQQHISEVDKMRNIFANPAPQPVACTKPTLSYYNRNLGDIRRKIYSNVNDVIVSAFNCDITRIANVYIEDFDDKNTDYAAFHGISHAPRKDASAAQQSGIWNGWIAQRVLDLMTKMSLIREADGTTMLDNTLIVWGSEFGYGDHGQFDVPIFVAGNAGGRLRMGQYIDYRQTPFMYYAGRGDIFGPQGRPYTQFLCSVMHALGVQPGEYRPYGQDGYFGSFNPSTYTKGEYTKYATVRNDPLPHFSVG